MRQKMESEVGDWLKNDQLFEKWDWIIALHNEVIKPTIESYLEEASKEIQMNLQQ